MRAPVKHCSGSWSQTSSVPTVAVCARARVEDSRWRPEQAPKLRGARGRSLTRRAPEGMERMGRRRIGDVTISGQLGCAGAGSPRPAPPTRSPSNRPCARPSGLASRASPSQAWSRPVWCWPQRRVRLSNRALWVHRRQRRGRLRGRRRRLPRANAVADAGQRDHAGPADLALDVPRAGARRARLEEDRSADARGGAPQHTRAAARRRRTALGDLTAARQRRTLPVPAAQQRRLRQLDEARRAALRARRRALARAPRGARLSASPNGRSGTSRTRASSGPARPTRRRTSSCRAPPPTRSTPSIRRRRSSRPARPARASPAPTCARCSRTAPRRCSMPSPCTPTRRTPTRSWPRSRRRATSWPTSAPPSWKLHLTEFGWATGFPPGDHSVGNDEAKQGAADQEHVHQARRAAQEAQDRLSQLLRLARPAAAHRLRRRA